MARNIDVEKVRSAVAKYGFDIPFYLYQTDIPRSQLDDLVENGLMIRGGNKRKGYIFTEHVNALFTEANARESRVASLKEAFLSPPEPYRGRAFGTRRVPSMPDADGNSTDRNSIDEN